MPLEESVTVAIPFAGNVEWLETFSMDSAFSFFLFDNSQLEGIRDICARRGIEYSKATDTSQRLDRINAWRECFTRASQLGNTWVKPLFAGDSLNYDSLRALDERFDFYIFRYRIKGRIFARTSRSPLIVGSMAKNIMKNGPWGGPPLAHAFKSKLFLEKTQNPSPYFGEWTADFSLMFNLLADANLILDYRIVGVFNAQARRTFKQLRNSLESLHEEISWMKFALEKYPNEAELTSSTIKRVIILALRRGRPLSLIKALSRLQRSK